MLASQRQQTLHHKQNATMSRAYKQVKSSSAVALPSIHIMDPQRIFATIPKASNTRIPAELTTLTNLQTSLAQARATWTNINFDILRGYVHDIDDTFSSFNQPRFTPQGFGAWARPVGVALRNAQEALDTLVTGLRDFDGRNWLLDAPVGLLQGIIETGRWSEKEVRENIEELRKVQRMILAKYEGSAAVGGGEGDERYLDLGGRIEVAEAAVAKRFGGG